MNTQDLSENFWDERYKQKTTGWDIGKISDPLKAYIQQLTDKHMAILIPGCGNAYEAEYLLNHGFSNVTVVDISPTLVNSLKEKLKDFDGKQLHIICDDFFNLEMKFDLILEQTFFCALDPELRNAYAEKMAQLLKPGGKLSGVLFNRSFDGGPPFGGNKKEYEKLFSPEFEIIKMEPCYNSIEPRAESELFILLKNR